MPALDPAPREEVLRFGDDDHVVGLLTLPTAPAAPATPAVIILNAGVLHRVGPHRLHVVLARRLAARGIPALRLDLSGIGDSSAATRQLSFRESSVADVRSAMDVLGQRLGSTRFMLFGICSGADNAMATAELDSRVTGLALVDSYSYATTQSRIREELVKARRLKAPLEVARWAGQRLGSFGAHLLEAGRRRMAQPVPDGESDAAAFQAQEGRTAPPLDVYRTMMAGLMSRHVAILMVFSGALRERYNDEGQLFEWLPAARGRVGVAYFPTANHTFTELSSREGLSTAVVSWLNDASIRQHPPAVEHLHR